MNQPQVRAEALLAAAQNSHADLQALFTQFGCHAFAFAAVYRLGGVALLMTEMTDPTWGPGPCVHAWCETGSLALDFFGQAPDGQAVFRRFRSQPGFSPPWRTGMAASKVESLNRSQIDQVLAGSFALPNGFYGEPGWLRRAMALANRLLADRGFDSSRAQ